MFDARGVFKETSKKPDDPDEGGGKQTEIWCLKRPISISISI